MLTTELACPDRCSENIRVLPIVVPELELIDVQREIFGADLMERSDDAALHQRPEAFDCVGMDVPMHIFPGPMVNCAAREFSVNGVITAPFVRGNKTHLVGNSLA